MRSTVSRGLVASLLFLCFMVLGAPAALAQAPNAAAIERWIDGFLAETRTAGATRAERGAVTADGSGGFTVAGVTIELPGGTRLALARIAGEGVSAGGRFSARRLRLEGFAATAGAVRVEAPQLELQGLDLPSLAPAAFFGRSDAGLFATLRELNLAQLSIPALNLEGTPPVAGRAGFSNIAVTNVARGVAERMTYGQSTVDMTDPTGVRINGTLGATEITRVDLALNASLFAPPPNPPSELALAYARATIAGGSMEISGGVKFTLGPIEVTNARLRPPRISYLEFLRLNFEIGSGTPTPAQMARIFAIINDYLDITETERMTIGQSRIETPEGNFTVGGFEASGLRTASVARMAVNGLEFQSPAANFSLGTFAVTEFDFTDFFRAAFQAMGTGAPIPDPAAFEGRLPRIGGIELREASLEATGQGEISLDNAAFAMGRWRGFVPDLLRLTVSELSIPAALIEAGGGVAPPRPSDLGYESIDIGSNIQIRIDESARTATLSPGRVEVDQLGAVAVELTLGDVDTGRFGFAGLSDPMPILQQVTVRELRLRVENAGFIDRYADWMERTQRVPAAQFRAQIVQGIAPLVEVFIQDAAQKERARAALQAFSREQRSLTLVVTPRSRMTLLDVMAATQGGGPPLQLLGQVNINLSAND